jgi:hypothetical protein
LVPTAAELVLTYEEALYGFPCRVELSFTPNNELLYLVTLSWADTAAAPKVREALVRAYGDPECDPDSDKRCAWSDPDTGDTVALDASGTPVQVLYAAGSEGYDE